MINYSIQCANRLLSLDSPVVMGILNVTPDSFSDGGLFSNTNAALLQAEKMLAEGAQIIDIGGESTRPGAPEVPIEQELDRVIPIIEAIDQRLDVIISIDTSKALVMKEAANAGAGMINDVLALRANGALAAAAQTGLPVCLMHMQGEPRTMQAKPSYHNVESEVTEFLTQRIEQCRLQGFKKEQLIIDPGFGFGKTLAHNIALFKHLTSFAQLGYPVLVGASRKSMIGQITHKEVNERLAGSIALATLAAINDAAIIRVHDVAQTVDALKIAQSLG